MPTPIAVGQTGFVRVSASGLLAGWLGGLLGIGVELMGIWGREADGGSLNGWITVVCWSGSKRITDDSGAAGGGAFCRRS